MQSQCHSGICSARIPTSTSHAPYLEGGMLFHVPQQLWLLGCCVVTHRAFELLPWNEAEDKVSIARLVAPACKGAKYTQVSLARWESRSSEGIKKAVQRCKEA